MIKISTVLCLLFFHWVGDLVLQSNWMARNKADRLMALAAHAFVYSLTIGAGVCMIDGYMPLFTGHDYIDKIIICTFSIHAIQDHVTSNIAAYLKTQGKHHLFVIWGGLDQLLHYVQLLLTYQLFTAWQ